MATYRDINPYVSVEGPPLSDDEDAVLASIINILFTRKGEREREPTFGSFLDDYLHDPVDETTAARIRISFVAAIEKWEPRVTIVQPLTTVTTDLSLPGFVANLAIRIAGLPTATQYKLYFRSKYGN